MGTRFVCFLLIACAVLGVGYFFFLSSHEKGAHHKEALRVPQPSSVKQAAKSPPSIPLKPAVIANPYPESITLRVRDLFQEEKFEDLNALLDVYYKGFESDIAQESSFFRAYLAFDTGEVSHEDLFKVWLDVSPDDYRVYSARAQYYTGLAWAVRGEKWASETTEEQFKGMYAYFEKAQQDARKAIDLKNDFIFPYYVLLSISHVEGHDDVAKNALEKALDIQPASYYIRRRHLNFLLPRWGGSLEEMQTFIGESFLYTEKNPKLKMLAGFPYMIAGDEQKTSRAYNSAKEFYTQALAYGENSDVLLERGKANYSQENYEEALKDLNKAVEVSPEDPHTYYWRALIHYELDHYNAAAPDIKFALLLKPKHEDYLSLRRSLADAFSREGDKFDKAVKYSEAIEHYTMALTLDPNGIRYYRRAKALSDNFQYDLALADAEKTVELDPDYFNGYLLIDWIIFTTKTKEWERIISHWDKYIALHPKNAEARVQRGGAHYHNKDIKAAVADLKIAADLGHPQGKRLYKRFKRRVEK